jgi:hypothetical protein
LLLKKYKRAKSGLTETKSAYDRLAESLDAVKVMEWKEQERRPMEERGDALRIFEVKLEKGESYIISFNMR